MTEINAVSRYLSLNLQALRKKRGLSQAQLSQLAEIPRSTITHIESGDGNPSLTNLCKLAAALNVSIEELLSRPRNECTLIKAADVAVLQRGADKVQVYKLMPDKIKGIEIDRMEFAANASLGGHPHLQGTKEYLVTLKGEVTVYVDGQNYTVRKGDVLAFPGDQRHSYKNPKSTAAIALSVVLPVPHLLG